MQSHAGLPFFLSSAASVHRPPRKAITASPRPLSRKLNPIQTLPDSPKRRRFVRLPPPSRPPRLRSPRASHRSFPQIRRFDREARRSPPSDRELSKPRKVRSFLGAMRDLQRLIRSEAFPAESPVSSAARRQRPHQSGFILLA